MFLPRPAALRASSIARFARPAKYIRTTELQPWQRVLHRSARRTYASAHGSQSATIKSDLPWAAGAAITLVGGLYVVLTQDLGHGAEDHDEHHGEKAEEADEEEAPAEEKEPEAKEESAEESKDKKEESKDEPKEDSKQEEDKSPVESDKPDPQKESKSQNETSGKQEGLSNTETKHPQNVSDNPDKSSKGEGVAETAKLKGTVSTERPGPENKEEQGKAEQDKSK